MSALVRLERPAVEGQEDPVGGVAGEARHRQLLGARGGADDAGREAPAGGAADDRRDERREAASPRRVAPRRRREPLRPLSERHRRFADRDRPASGGGERLAEAGEERPGEVDVGRRRVRERPPLGGLSRGRAPRASRRAAPGPSGGAGGLRRGGPSARSGPAAAKAERPALKSRRARPRSCDSRSVDPSSSSVSSRSAPRRS